MPDVRRVVLAFTGGLDTSLALRWLAERHHAEVVALLVDLGQPFDEGAVRARAEQAGAAETLVLDGRDEFAERFALPTLRAGALYEGRYPLVSALSRPLIAQKLVEVARDHGSAAIAHGCTGRGNDQVRFEAAAAALAPDLAVLAPVREAGFGREEAAAWVRERGIEVPDERAAYSIDGNLWGRSIEAAPLEDPWLAPSEEPFLLTRDPRLAPDEPQEIVLAFEAGVPTSLDGAELEPADLLGALNGVAGAHGVGRIDMIENRLVGIKSREVYEAPAATVLYAAHAALESLVLERDLLHVKAELAPRYAEAVYNGLWFSPLREALDAFVASTQTDVTGEVRVRLYKGGAQIVGRRAPRSLYDEPGAPFQPDVAEGFSRIFSLPARTWAARHPEGNG